MHCLGGGVLADDGDVVVRRCDFTCTLIDQQLAKNVLARSLGFVCDREDDGSDNLRCTNREGSPSAFFHASNSTVS